ncbi:retrovirus-related Pol polyprotein from transposon TNT 1-94 [Trichonephila clavipes]|nr:retrovirus-related Pol polyprotein from transposon TNT 1-94 [Trichonephila clavipes]
MGHLIANCKGKLKSSKYQSDNNFIIEACIDQEVNTNDYTWVFDTAASTHFCNNQKLFVSYEPVNNTTISLAIGEITSPVEGVGTVKFYFDGDNGRNNITLHNVINSPKLRRNLMSGPALDKNGCTFVGGKGKIEIFNRNGRKLFYARKINELYYFKPKYPKNIHIEKSNLTTSEEKDLELWHNRFCHINSKYILRSSQNESIRGIPKLKLLM